jgi:DNA-binding IclR family transcriptional regulator
MDTMITFPVDPDLSDVRSMVLREVEAGRGDTVTPGSLANRFGLPLSSITAALSSLTASGLLVADGDGFASAFQLD